MVLKTCLEWDGECECLGLNELWPSYGIFAVNIQPSAHLEPSSKTWPRAKVSQVLTLFPQLELNRIYLCKRRGVGKWVAETRLVTPRVLLFYPCERA